MNHDVNKLPKWAQYHIQQLEEEVKNWKEQAEEYRHDAWDYQERLEAEYQNQAGESL